MVVMDSVERAVVSVVLSGAEAVDEAACVDCA